MINSFPGYEYKDGKNIYRGVDLGRGGYVYAEPGIYYNVALLDLASMHPHSIIAMNCFGQYTDKFKELIEARVAIKHKDYESAKKMLNGKLAKYLDDGANPKALSNALKTAINSVYGLTSASFDNPFRDVRNKNNIVALRGALFMKTLQDEVASRGYKVAHIKTDSIKIVNADDYIIGFCMDFAKKYGYEFEHEATYDRICLVNNAVYIAKYAKDYIEYDDNGNAVHGGWTATGAEFAHPYIFKTLFSHEDLEFKDFCETKSVKTAIYLDMNEHLEDVSQYEKEYDKLTSKDPELYFDRIQELKELIAKGHNYVFVGRVGSFCPIVPGGGGGRLVRINEDKYDSVTGAKDWRWLESEVVLNLNKENLIDEKYFHKLAFDAIDNISKFGDFDDFVEEIRVYPWTSSVQDDSPPWD